ncbi:ribonuclease H-like domain-containing protein [Pyrenochaeta sp. MPI-SDFR-AT-0127]|nr:ribonuclease H-like domain-containing protein [Pyrenochaeta sp. MPI-SDFR-AT-0127]
MDVDAASFPHQLLGLFINISEAEFVSFDLELSGIPSRLPNKQPRGPGRLTLQERYAETKAGADRYQILQVGITCARFDYIANKYVLRPYNINISPLLSERLDFEREISFQSGACTFLLSNGFDLGAPFASGVQYLSREEADRAKSLAWDRIDKKNPVEDLQLTAEDVESLDFLRRTREAIIKWKTGTSSYLELTTHTGLKEQPLIPAISRFEKRLVHQLVRAEFPDLVSMGRADCVRIIDFNPLREAENTRRAKNRVKEQIIRQTGFRWVFEALVHGGHVDLADPLCLTRSHPGMSMTADSHDIKDRYDRATERLKVKTPVLVGHNMFTDIVYLYRTFVGELPETLEGFQNEIHSLFPKIIDTKYLATHAEGDLNASPTLQEIAEGISGQSLPSIITHADHSKYKETEAFHEAGYDSLLTATIMLRLAAKLDAERREKTPSPEPETRPGEGMFISARSVGDVQDFVCDGREKLEHSISLPPIEKPQLPNPQAQSGGKSRRKGKKNRKNITQTKEATVDLRFCTKNIFDNLRVLALNPENGTDTSVDNEQIQVHDNTQASKCGEQDAEAAGSWENEVFVQDTSGWVPIKQVQRQPMELIPTFDSDFWKEFGNKLRVFGTQEAVLRVANWGG